MKNLLTIAGSDCSGGAGIQADLKTFSAHGKYGMSAITAVVAENTARVLSVLPVSPAMIRDQIDAVFADISVDGVKIGMLPDAESMDTVADALAKYRPQKPVIDPVMVAKGGCALMERGALQALKQKIIPRAYILTPNIPEAEAITGISVKSPAEMQTAAKMIFDLGAKNVVIKGGHMASEATDILFDGEGFHTFPQKRVFTKNTHGTGCTFSSAIACYLADGLSAPEAVLRAKAYITGAIVNALSIGHGHGPTNHFFALYKKGGLTP